MNTVAMNQGTHTDSEPTTRRAMRKALLRLHMQTHREALSGEVSRMLHPMQRMQGGSGNILDRIRHAGTPVWAGGAALLLGLVARRRRKGKGGGVVRLIRLGMLLAPVAKMAWSRRSDSGKRASAPVPPSTWKPPSTSTSVPTPTPTNRSRPLP